MKGYNGYTVKANNEPGAEIMKKLTQEQLDQKINKANENGQPLVLKEYDLSRLKINGNIDNAVFYDCLLQKTDFSGHIATGVSFQLSKCAYTVFENVIFNGVNMDECTIFAASFEGSIIKNIGVSHARCHNVKLKNSIIKGIYWGTEEFFNDSPYLDNAIISNS